MGKYALLIGVDTYGEGLQPLPAASKDVAALSEVLLNPNMGRFDEVKPLINPSQSQMAREIELWFQDRQPEDLVLLFFSGHGVKDDRRDLYFAAANTEKQHNRLLISTATPARFLHDCIRACKAKHQVLILDCCFSGAFGELVPRDGGEIPLKEQLGAEGRVVLTSTSAVDYSFEEKGVDLSIYTRYLVEGIATGAADEDGDGAITVDELHRYAGRKVKKTSPTMSPTLITLKDEGFRIQVACSPQDDPKLKYRKESERRATEGEFTIPAQRLLMNLRAELGLSEAEAEAIEAEVLKPYREYQRKRQEYQETLRQCLERESPLSQRTANDLRDYRAHLRLKPEDVATIEQTALNGHNLEEYVSELERQRQEQAQRQREEAERQKRAVAANQPKPTASPVNPVHTDQDNLSSEWFGFNYYAKLRNLLAAKDWKAADQETTERMCEVMDRRDEGWLRVEDIEGFPCLDLRNIDRLWVKYSNGKFGFSVQKEIWQSCGSLNKYRDWERFGVVVGWRTEGVLRIRAEWLSYAQLTFDLVTAPKGHLPAPPTGWWGLGPEGRGIFSRVETCRL